MFILRIVAFFIMFEPYKSCSLYSMFLSRIAEYSLSGQNWKSQLRPYEKWSSWAELSLFQLPPTLSNRQLSSFNNCCRSYESRRYPKYMKHPVEISRVDLTHHFKCDFSDLSAPPISDQTIKFHAWTMSGLWRRCDNQTNIKESTFKKTIERQERDSKWIWTVEGRRWTNQSCGWANRARSKLALNFRYPATLLKSVSIFIFTLSIKRSFYIILFLTWKKWEQQGRIKL